MPAAAWLVLTAAQLPMVASAQTPTRFVATAKPTSQAGTDRIAIALRRAIESYQASDFESARRQLREVLRAIADPTDRRLAEAYTYLGYVELAFGRSDAAVRAFQRALKVQPALELRGLSPKLSNAWKEAKRRHRAMIRALDHDPPRLRHVPHNSQPYGRALRVEVSAQDVSAIGKIAVHYRNRGNRGFISVDMEPSGHGRYVATVPRVAVVQPGVEYYIEAYDKLGNGPGLKGSAQLPIRVTVKGGPAPLPKATPKAWYKRWWVWAAAASAVAAAGAIGVGVYLARDEQARVDVRLDPRLDP